MFSEFVTKFIGREEQLLNDLYAPVPMKSSASFDTVQLGQGDLSPFVEHLLDMWVQFGINP